MIFFIIEWLNDSSSIISGDSLTFPVSYRDKRIGVEQIPDQFMDLCGVVFFVHNAKARMSNPMALFQEFFGLGDSMNRLLGDLQSGNNLLISIDRDRGFQDLFSSLTGSLGIVVACVWAGEPGWINSCTWNLLTPVIKHLYEPVERRWSDPLTELMDCREMGNLIEMDFLSKWVHDISKFYCVPVVFR